MCQSRSQGGRRCTGRSTSSTPAVNIATAERDQPGAPTRQQVEVMAANLPADRKGWDGTPLDDAGKRLYALRESGYDGPIDQDGWPDTTSEAAQTLYRMAEIRRNR